MDRNKAIKSLDRIYIVIYTLNERSVKYVENNEYTTVNYVSPTGTKPVDDFIFDPQRTDDDRKKIFAVVSKLEKDGTKISRMFSELLRGKIFELKIRTQRTLFRILYAWLPGKKALFLHAFEKDTPKTPNSEIKIAETRLKDYYLRISMKGE